ncbi:hypothetical protein HHX47_DHR1000511 [Lentinula edodes]|nr:hypothetical protein HHX47_DHR1000511 [Lentinula edodes]
MPNPSSSKAINSEVLGKASLVELKNGKVLFKQKPLSFEKHSETLQELVNFREMIQGLINNHGSALVNISDEYKPLIAKLVHESDKTLSALAKHLHSQLLPPDDDGDEGDAHSRALLLPSSIIEVAIQTVAQRNNYGIETDLGVKAPASTCVWRWEVRESYRHWLPKNAQEKASNRLAERVKAKNDLMIIFRAIPEEEQRSILHLKANIKVQNNDKGKAVVIPTTMQSPGQASSSTHSLDPPEANGTENGDIKVKVGRPKKDAEKAKKEKDAQKSLMSSFFTKSKFNLKTSSSKVSVSAIAGPSTSCSDFDKTFKPFTLKKGAHLAPINAFLERKPTAGTRDDVIIVDEDASPPVASTNADAVNTSARALPPPVSKTWKRPPKSATHGMKTYCPVSVRDLMKQLSEVEVFGDTSSVRKIHNKLSDRILIPGKVFIFDEDSRPGYYGTWTRSSRLIGARTPFAKDVLELDYGYDSGEDWEEEPAGDADDVMDDAEDDAATEDQDSDIDDWLVEDDEVEEDIPADERAGSPIFNPLPKRRADDAPPQTVKKRKVVVQLVPFAKAEEQKSVRASEKGFAVPALPNHIVQASTAKGSDTGSSPAPVVAPSGPKKPAFTPKTAFPDEHLPILLSKINTAQAANLTVLVEAVSQELREHKVKKNAIEAKIREVGEKCKVRKFWVVKENHPVGIA